jgi:hypothetical protein
MKNENRNCGFTFFRTYTSHNVFRGNPIVLRHQWADQHNPILRVEFIPPVDPVPPPHARVGLPRLFKGCSNF